MITSVNNRPFLKPAQDYLGRILHKLYDFALLFRNCLDSIQLRQTVFVAFPSLHAEFL